MFEIRKNKVIQNYLYNLSYQIVITVLPIITTPYLTRVLGADNLGIARYVAVSYTHLATEKPTAVGR